MTSGLSALITGSSRGIGFGIASRLAERGYALTLAGRDAKRLAEAASTFEQLGAPEIICAAGDVREDSYLAALADTHQQRFQTLDALIVNAGAGSAGALADFHVARFDKQIAVNL
ncbi:SDR family NAD(P)-dependent oxidoreductase, partial [Mycobacterium avium]